MTRHKNSLPKWLESFNIGEIRWWEVPETDGDDWIHHPPPSRTKVFARKFKCVAHIAHSGSINNPPARLFRVERIVETKPFNPDSWDCPLERPDCKRNCGNYGCGN